MDDIKWIYRCRPTKEYWSVIDEYARFETEHEAVRWCEEMAIKHRGYSFEYYKYCYIPLK